MNSENPEDKPICEECEKNGLKYKIFKWRPAYAVIDSGCHGEEYWDENGRYFPKEYWWTEYFKCSNGHSFSRILGLD